MSDPADKNAVIAEARETLDALAAQLEQPARSADAVRALRDVLAGLLDSLGEIAVRMPFVRLDAAVKYGLGGGSMRAASRAVEDLSGALQGLATSRPTAPILSIAAKRARPAPPPPPPRHPHPLPKIGDTLIATPKRPRPSASGTATSPPPPPRGLAPTTQKPPPPAPQKRDVTRPRASATRGSSPEPETAPAVAAPTSASVQEPSPSPHRSSLTDTPRTKSGEFIAVTRDRRSKDSLAAALAKIEHTPAPSKPAPSAAIAIRATPPSVPPSAPVFPSTSTSTPPQDDSGTNRLLFDALHSEPAPGALDELTQTRSRPSNPFASFDSAVDVAWLDNEALDDLDDELASATEPSGLHELDELPQPLGPRRRPIPGRTDSGLIPFASGSRFEDSGLFLIFIDDSEVEGEPRTGFEPENDELSVEIDVTGLQETQTRQAFRGFVDQVEGILQRFLDSLELALVHHESGELLDVSRQLNRLARVLDFVELDRQLSLIAYLQETLPLRFQPWSAPVLIGRPVLEVDEEAIAGFQGRLGDFLNSVVYLFGYLSWEIPGLPGDRYQEALVELFDALGILPSEPPITAPVGLYGHADGLKLTSRTRALLARTTEHRVTEALDAVESGLLHGMPEGFVDAGESLLLLAQLLADHAIPDVPRRLGTLAVGLMELGPLQRPDQRFVITLEDSLVQLEPLLPPLEIDVLTERARLLIERVSFSERVSTGRTDAAKRSAVAFKVSWPRFRRSASPYLDALLGVAHVSDDELPPPVLETLRSLSKLASQHHIELLARLLGTLEEHWQRAPHTCSHVLEDLAASIRALPVDGTRYAQLEALARSIVNDLVRRRSLTGSAGASEELSTIRVRLVSQIDALLKSVREDARRPGHSLARHRPAARELADTARRRDFYALALGLEVLADVIAVEAPNDTLRGAVDEAADVLLACTDYLVATIDTSDDRGSAAHVDTWFALALARDIGRDGPFGVADALFERAFAARIAPLCDAIDEVWSGEVDRRQNERYTSSLEAIRQAVAYAGHGALAQQIADHNISVSGFGDRTSQELQHAWEALRDQLRPESPPPPSLATASLDFLALARRWAADLSLRLSRTDDPEALRNWPQDTRGVLEQLATLAREASSISLLGLVAELRDVLVVAAGLPYDTPPPRLYAYVNQLVVVAETLNPQAAAELPEEVRATLPTSIRVPLEPTLEVTGAAAGLARVVNELEALINAGPLTFAAHSGRATLQTFKEQLDGFRAHLRQMLPETLPERAGLIDARLRHRASLLGLDVTFATDVENVSLAEVPATVSQAVGTLFAAAEVLLEALVVLLHEIGTESGPADLTLDFGASNGGFALAIVHNAAGLDLQRCRDALVEERVPVSNDKSVVAALAASPRALRHVHGGIALLVAQAMVSVVGAEIELGSSSGRHRLRLLWHAA